MFSDAIHFLAKILARYFNETVFIEIKFDMVLKAIMCVCVCVCQSANISLHIIVVTMQPNKVNDI